MLSWLAFSDAYSVADEEEDGTQARGGKESSKYPQMAGSYESVRLFSNLPLLPTISPADSGLFLRFSTVSPLILALF